MDSLIPGRHCRRGPRGRTSATGYHVTIGFLDYRMLRLGLNVISCFSNPIFQNYLENMTIAIPGTNLLPVEAQREYVKPTPLSTKGGKSYQPTHPELFEVQGLELPVQGADDAFASRLVALKDFAPNEVITSLENISAAPVKAYSSVQYGPGPHQHLELNSDLLFMNHSCAPTACIDLTSSNPREWVVRTLSKGIKNGEAISFFYPSTEWDMAQAFDCNCGAAQCLGKIAGAKNMTEEQLNNQEWINGFIKTLKQEQKARQ